MIFWKYYRPPYNTHYIIPIRLIIQLKLFYEKCLLGMERCVIGGSMYLCLQINLGCVLTDAQLFIVHIMYSQFKMYLCTALTFFVYYDNFSLRCRLFECKKEIVPTDCKICIRERFKLFMVSMFILYSNVFRNETKYIFKWESQFFSTVLLNKWNINKITKLTNSFHDQNQRWPPRAFAIHNRWQIIELVERLWPTVAQSSVRLWATIARRVWRFVNDCAPQTHVVAASDQNSTWLQHFYNSYMLIFVVQ